MIDWMTCESVYNARVRVEESLRRVVPDGHADFNRRRRSRGTRARARARDERREKVNKFQFIEFITMRKNMRFHNK